MMSFTHRFYTATLLLLAAGILGCGAEPDSTALAADNSAGPQMNSKAPGDQQPHRSPSPATASPAAGSAIMNEALDGSSVAAFKQGLDQVKAGATASEYQSLRNAIGFMLNYDLSVSRSQEKLYAKLDGLTPNEIVAKRGGQ